MRLAVTRLATAVAVLLLAAPLAPKAQPAGKVYRIGVLLNRAPHTVSGYEVFADALREAGYVEGRNLLLVVRHTEGYEQLPRLTIELLRMNPDLLVTFGTPTLAAAAEVTQTIPIVAVALGEPERYVASLGRPGGNIAGVSTVNVELAEKRLDLLKQVVPNLARIAVFWSPLNPAHPAQLRATMAAASALGVRTRPFEVRGPAELQDALNALGREPVDALIALPHGVFQAHRRAFIEFATPRRVAIVGSVRDWPRDGALMSYGVDLSEMWRSAVRQIDKILKGTKPSDLPVEQPTRFELVINLKTAKALGLTIPPPLLLRADQVIE